jgi:hypothetical protein
MLQKLDHVTFDPIGMKMPKWVFYDCAEVPGGIFGFARRAHELPEWARRALGADVDDYDGPIPLSMFVAIPMLEPDAWHTYSLSSLNEVAPGSAPAGLRILTKAIGLQLLDIKKAYGATQWRSPTLAIHARFGPLDLITAWTPAHSDPRTLTYSSPVSAQRIEQALSAGRIELPTESEITWLDCDDNEQLIALQEKLEAGRRFQIVGEPRVDGSYTLAPLVECEA